MHPIIEDDEEGDLCLLDPALTLVRCEDKVFLSVFQVLSIRQDGTEVQSLPSRFLREPNVFIQGQVIKLALIDGEATPGAPDWEWNGGFEARAALRDIEGNWIELVDPLVRPASRGRNTGDDTYVFQTSELRGISALLYERLNPDLHRLPSILTTNSFPYRSETGMSRSNLIKSISIVLIIRQARLALCAREIQLTVVWIPPSHVFSA